VVKSDDGFNSFELDEDGETWMKSLTDNRSTPATLAAAWPSIRYHPVHVYMDGKAVGCAPYIPKLGTPSSFGSRIPAAAPATNRHDAATRISNFRYIKMCFFRKF
jgi:hypothetical protein